MQDQRAFHLLQPLILSLCRVVLECAELLWIERFLFILRQRRWRADAARRKKNCICFCLPPLFCISMSAQMSRDRRSARKDPYLCKCANVCVCARVRKRSSQTREEMQKIPQSDVDESVGLCDCGIFNVLKIPISPQGRVNPLSVTLVINVSSFIVFLITGVLTHNDCPQ